MYGCVGGMFGTIISHPIDTIRINLQSCKTPNYTFLSLYKGILTPILGIGIEKSVVFGSYNLTNKMLPNIIKDTSIGNFISGVNAGLHLQ